MFGALSLVLLAVPLIAKLAFRRRRGAEVVGARVAMHAFGRVRIDDEVVAALALGAGVVGVLIALAILLLSAPIAEVGPAAIGAAFAVFAVARFAGREMLLLADAAERLPATHVQLVAGVLVIFGWPLLAPIIFAEALYREEGSTLILPLRSGVVRLPSGSFRPPRVEYAPAFG